MKLELVLSPSDQKMVVKQSAKPQLNVVSLTFQMNVSNKNEMYGLWITRKLPVLPTPYPPGDRLRHQRCPHTNSGPGDLQLKIQSVKAIKQINSRWKKAQCCNADLNRDLISPKATQTHMGELHRHPL